jgi:hypothetical protein
MKNVTWQAWGSDERGYSYYLTVNGVDLPAVSGFASMQLASQAASNAAAAILRTGGIGG